MGGLSNHRWRIRTRSNTSATRHHFWSDLGFRVERQRGNRVTGTLVVRVNGEWLVAEPAEGVKALSSR